MQVVKLPPDHGAETKVFCRLYLHDGGARPAKSLTDETTPEAIRAEFAD